MGKTSERKEISKDVLLISFDQYQRYKLVSDIINQYRQGNEKLKILEIGASFEENIIKFLPNDEIFFLDKEYPPEYKYKKNYIVGDIMQIDLQERYDFVVSIDTYEHIPPALRNKYFDKLILLSEKATIVAAPFNTTAVSECEIFSNETYKLSHENDYKWLQEHIRFGLPSLSVTLKMIQDFGLEYRMFPNGYLPRWFENINLYLLTEGYPGFSEMLTNYWKFYNENFYEYDNRHPAYRQVILVDKSGKVPDFSNIEAKKHDQEDFKYKCELMQKLISRIKESYHLSSFKELNLAVNKLQENIEEKDILIKEKVYGIKEGNIRIKEIYDQIKKKDDQIKRQAIDLQEKENIIRANEIRSNSLVAEINEMRNSVLWNMTMKFHNNFVEKLFPHGTRRRVRYDLGLRGSRILLKEGPRQTLWKFKEYRKMSKNRILIDKSTNSDLPGIEASEYVSLSEKSIDLKADDIKLIAFYLPQFHPIPENDKWWGKGFTEWTNVSKALPQFVGHYQPHLPGELGFYDLRLVEVQKRQVELAKQYGIYGFCFHYYWFGGKRLLERPLNQFLQHQELDIPFCLCWANENWTRRWDGLDNEILISQENSPENDFAFIKDLEDIFKDPRYIRVNGKPLLIVYRALLLPDAKKTAKRWRKYCNERGIGDLYIVAAQGFGFDDPRKVGFDAAIEFPPHTMYGCANITNKMRILNPDFSGNVFDYEDFVRSKNYLKPTKYKLFKTVSPGWDNTARKLNSGTIYYGSTPNVFKKWLLECVKFTRISNTKDEQFVFINAWNEWGEGAHLEPDRKYGYGYLQAVNDAIIESRETVTNSFSNKDNKKIIYVSHDAHYHGAQMLALNTVKLLKERFRYDVYVILKSGGRLEEEFTKFATVYNLERDYNSPSVVEELVDRLGKEGVQIAICNTIVSGDMTKVFFNKNICAISLVHELPELIRAYNMGGNARTVSQFADKIIFPSKFVWDKFNTIAEIPSDKGVVQPQGVYFKNPYKGKNTEARYKLRELYSLPADANVILSVAYADYRKAPDLFVSVAKKVLESMPETYFIWVGHHDDRFMAGILTEIKKSKLEKNILFIGHRPLETIDYYYAGADLYLLTSREDPFPSTVLESMDVGIPVIGFDNAGGFRDIVTTQTGVLVPYLDINKMAESVIELLQNPTLREKFGSNSSDLIGKRYQFVDYVYRLLDLLDHKYMRVSVVVPNFNYAHYLPGRLQSIINQSYPIYEIIILDDASSDNSRDIIRDFSSKSKIPVKLIFNEKNSGSVSRQWSTGITCAQGDYIWIAEADDLSSSQFLEEVMKGFLDENVVMSYCQSKQIDQSGKILEHNYLKYTNDVDTRLWNSDYTRSGLDEICNTMAVKNTIPNVSAAVFKNYDVMKIIDSLTQYKIAGDWFFYVWMLQKGQIHYCSKSLNIHRRHVGGVTLSENSEWHFNEIVAMQDYVNDHFSVDSAVRDKALKYRDEVRQYLIGKSK